MTTTPQCSPDAVSPGSDAIGGCFTRLNPADGLFLRAEHLDRMQRYASDLVAAVGAGLGPGVVYGFTGTLSESNDAVQVTSGLAFASGQPLCSGETLTVSLDGLASSGDDFWVVEIVPVSWLYGSEPVYGGLCEDPCGHGSGIHPFAAEGVELRLRHDSIDGFGGAHNRRNWLASKYFEREREYGGESVRSANAPWLMPDTPGGGVRPIGERPWSAGTGPHDAAAVPLGVVWKDDGEWQLDVWTARRDRGDPTPLMAWQWRLGWRPHRVFIAQILQFQAQLAQARNQPPYPQTPKAKQLLKHLAEASEQAAKIQSRKVEDVMSSLAEARQMLEPDGVLSLPAMGFDELPPAGYLPLGFETLRDADAVKGEIFGDEVDVRVRCCRADYVAHAIEEVQHMDRIPLIDFLTPPKIDLLVPQVNLTDLKTTMPSPAYYGWSAFVRRRDDENEQRRDKVRVFLLTLDLNEAIDEAVRQIAADASPPARLEDVGTVTYPAGEWALPTDEASGGKSAWLKVHERLKGGPPEVVVLGVAHEEDRQPLAAARASLFVVPKEPTDRPVTLPATYVIVDPIWPEKGDEAIVVGLPIVTP